MRQGLIVGLIAVAVLIVVGWRLQLSLRVKLRVNAIKAQGLPISSAELDRYYPAVPQAENAALVITQALALLRNYPDRRSNAIAKFQLPQSSESLTEAQRELLAGYVEVNLPAIAKAREGLARTNCRYPVDLSPGWAAHLPHLYYLKDLERVVTYQGILSAESSKPDTAVESIITLLGLANTLKAEPSTVAQLFRQHLEKSANTVLEISLGAGGLGDAQLAVLEFLFRRPDRTNGYFRAMVGERAVGISTFADYGKWKTDSPDYLTEQDEIVSSAVIKFWRLNGTIDRDLLFFLSIMATNVALTLETPPGNLVANDFLSTVRDEAKKSKFLLSAILLSASSKIHIRFTDSIAESRLALTALAIERFRFANHRLPTSLADLPVGQEQTSDPYTGLPLYYEKREAGYIIYSVGRDGEDDGGDSRPSSSNPSDPSPLDITFIVKR
jgi:type II secretory pathway pseudopilin PulG